MRLGPGKHLKGRSLMGGIVKPEEVGPGASQRLLSFCLTSFHSSTISTRYRGNPFLRGTDRSPQLPVACRHSGTQSHRRARLW
jgi:hypothetical protein